MKVPYNVLNLLHKRSNAAKEFNKANMELAEWLKSNGLYADISGSKALAAPEEDTGRILKAICGNN